MLQLFNWTQAPLATAEASCASLTKFDVLVARLRIAAGALSDDGQLEVSPPGASFAQHRSCHVSFLIDFMDHNFKNKHLTNRLINLS